MTTPAYMMPLAHMTFDEAFAILADAQKQNRTVTLFCECTGESWHMRPGQKYTHSGLKVHKIRKIRRQWEEPGKEAILELPKNGGALTLKSNQEATVKRCGDNGFMVLFFDDPNVYHQYTIDP